MSGDRPATDLGVEREIDLKRWRDALLAQRWIVIGGLVAGVILGALYSLSGGSTYTATAVIAPGQAFNPSGSTAVLTYLTSETAINTIATQTSTLEAAAAKAGLTVGELRGHVTTSAVNEGAGTPAANRNAVLVEVTVQLAKAKKAEDAANALAEEIKNVTTSSYVKQSLSYYDVKLKQFKQRETSELALIAAAKTALDSPSGQSLQPLDRLVLAQQYDQAVAAYGQTQDNVITTEQQLTLAQSIEVTQIITQAKAEKSTARSHRNSLLVGALIGLIVGGLAAIVLGTRPPRKRPA